MTRGFITLAVGQESYYELAYNLLISYRKTNGSAYPWTLVCDRKNQWTEAFDNIILLDKPYRSYMDKLTLFSIAPYDESIFIDSDCLVFRDISFLWDRMTEVDGFSCFGKSLPLDSSDGWFLLDDIGDYRNQISYIPSMHGGICFIKNSDKRDCIMRLAREIEANYDRYKFKYFEKPADEPILALAMAIEDSHPLVAQKDNFVFLPAIPKCEQRHVVLQSCSFAQKGSDAAIGIVHYQNHNTKKALYRLSKRALIKNKNATWFHWMFEILIDEWYKWKRRITRMLK